VFRVHSVSDTAEIELRSGRVEAPARRQPLQHGARGARGDQHEHRRHVVHALVAGAYTRPLFSSI